MNYALNTRSFYQAMDLCQYSNIGMGIDKLHLKYHSMFNACLCATDRD